MSRTIDERVVSMQFDNRHFETNVQTTMSTLDKLKAKLNLTGATKGLETVDAAAKKVNMSGIGSAIDTIQTKFSALQIMGVTTLANLTNSAVNASKRIASALTIDPIKTGFSEYETQIGAVQTILANTESKGTTLQDVNRALDELNTYADKTIYNFTQMTKNIGTFTAAGVDLDKSVSSIKGIANLAAVSGSTSQQASTAMYQLSQALAAGRVSLMDWNSVVNAGMGGQVFQDALKRTSEVMGTGAEAAIKKYGSFRESLTQGKWLTVDVLTKTLEQFTMAAEEGSEQWELYKQSLRDEGYTEKQALEILKMANTATDAATKVKTFTQLWDTLKESAQSGWTQTWELIIGDFGEAKEFLTNISETIGGMLNSSAEARNTMLAGGLSSGWKQLLNAGIADEAGYQDIIKKVAKEHNVAFDKMIEDNETFEKALKVGLKDGSITADMLTESVSKLADKMTKMSKKEREAAGYTEEHVVSIKKLNEGLKDGSVSMVEFTEKITRSSGRENLINSLWNSFNAILSIIEPIKKAFSEVFPAMTGDQLYEMTVQLEKFTSKLTISETTADKIGRTFKGLFSIFDIFTEILNSAAKVVGSFIGSEGVASLADLFLEITASIGDFFTAMNEGFKTDGVTGALIKGLTVVSDVLTAITGGMSGIAGVLSDIGGFILNTLGAVGKGIEKVFTFIGDNFNALDIFAALAGGGVALASAKFSGALDKVTGALKDFLNKEKSSKLTAQISEVLGSVHDSLNAFVTGLNVWSLAGVAIAIATLTSALRTLSELDGDKVGRSLLSMALLFTMLTVSFRSIVKVLATFTEAKGIIQAGIMIMAVAKSIDILATAIEKIGSISIDKLVVGLAGVAIALGELVLATRLLSKADVKLSTSVAILALAESCVTLAEAVTVFSKMSWEKLARGLTGMGIAMAELVAVIKIMEKTSGFKSLAASVSLLIAVQALDEMYEALKNFGSMTWEEIGKGLAAMGGALAELGLTMGLLGKFASPGSIAGAISLVIGVQALDKLAEGLQKFAYMSWDTSGRGLAAMGVALTELGLVIGLLGKLTGFSGIIGATALVIGVQALEQLAESLQTFGQMPWDVIGRGLTAMGGALTELGLVIGLLGGITSLNGIIGATAILIGVQSLGDLADAMKKFGEMTWEEIGRGLVGMGGALTEVAVITGVLGTLAPLGGLLGAGSILLAVQSLGDLADALKEFGSMSWDEIQRGLTAMGLALAEIAHGSFLNTIGIIGSMAISEVAKPLGVLADSVKKWSDVKLPENLGLQLGGLSAAITSFTLGGFGAMTIATVAEPLGQLADSVKKWTDVVVPDDLPAKVGSLAKGISAYTLSGIGAGAFAKAAPAVGQLADSVRKWTDLEVPEDLPTKIASLSKAIGSFGMMLFEAWSMDAVAEPFGEFTEAVKKWTNVTIPEGLADDLSELAGGIKAFGSTLFAGWSMDAVHGPLGKLANAVKKWKDITIPDDLSTKLKGLASAIKSFSGVSLATSLTDGFKKIASAVKTLSNVKMAAVIEDLGALGTSLSNFAGSCESITGVGDSITKNIIKPITDATSKFTELGSDIIRAVGDGVEKNSEALVSAISNVVTDSIDDIGEQTGAMEAAGGSLADAVVSGVRGSHTDMYTAGSYLVDGFASGISANRYKAAAQARAMAGAAAQAARSELDEHSPSRVGYEIGDFFGVAFVNAIGDYANKAYNASANMASLAKEGLRNAINNLANMIDSDINTQPTIRPVLDLSDVSSGAYAINSMLSMSPSVGVLSNVGSINTMMNSRQNGGNDDVISAINGLKKALGERTGDTYNVNGISYNEGSDVATAIKALTRAVKMEGRS